jgi:hypothetical protein
MYYVLLRSAYWPWWHIESLYVSGAQETPHKDTSDGRSLSLALHRIAITQGVFAILVLLRGHVQIITRLSSGYPVWYWWLAQGMLGKPSSGRSIRGIGSPKALTQWMIAYGIVQGGLYASFLPPA